MERVGVRIVALDASAVCGRNLLVTIDLLVSLYNRDPFSGALEVGE